MTSKILNDSNTECKQYHISLLEHNMICREIKDELKDYKFFCFNGEPQFFKVDFGRFNNHHANYYNLNWELLDIGEELCPPLQQHQELKPDNFKDMIRLVRILSKSIPFIRVDLYNIAGKIYFGELTFFPASGFGKFIKKDTDKQLGALLKLPSKV